MKQRHLVLAAREPEPESLDKLKERLAFYHENFTLIRYLCLKYKSSPFEALDAIKKITEDVLGLRKKKED